MTKYNNVRINDIVDINKHSYRNNDNWEFMNYLDTGNITDNKINNMQHLIFGNDNIPSRARRKVSTNDIVYSTVRPNQRHFGIIKKPIEGMLASTGFAVISTKEDEADSHYVYYYLTQNTIVNKLHAIAEQSVSAYPSIKPSDIGNLEISLPPLPTQRRIAAILSSLDDKIENNRRTCEKLEEMAQAIFKQWFVEERTDEWEEYSLYELMDIMSGGTPKTNASEFWEGNIPFFTPKDADTEVYCMNTEKKITKEGLKNCNSKLYATKTVFITARGTVGKVSMAGIPMAMNQSCYALKGKQNLSQEFIYLILKSSIENFIKQSHGAVFNSIIVNTFKSIKTWLPTLNDEKIKVTVSILNELFNIILVKQKQNTSLVKIRDTLLPKLMSGEIDLEGEG